MDRKGDNFAGILRQSTGDGVLLSMTLPRALELVDLEAGSRNIKPRKSCGREVASLSEGSIATSTYSKSAPDGLASGDFAALQPDQEDGQRVDEPAPPDKAPAADEDRYLLRIARDCVSLAIKISHRGVFGTTWVAAEAAATLGLGGSDPGRLSLVIVLLGLLVAGLIVQVLLATALDRRGTACSRRRQVILLCVADGLLVITVVVMALRVITASRLLTYLLRSTLTGTT